MNVAPARPAYCALADYAAIGDCRSAALVARDGAVDWLCWPDFGSDAVFAAIVDRRKGGYFQMSAERTDSISRQYVDGTNVLETTFVTDTGVMRLTDSLSLGASAADGLAPQRELLRIAEVVAGRVELRLDYVPRPGFALKTPALRAHGNAAVHGDSEQFLYLHASMALDVDSESGSVRVRRWLSAAEKHYFSLSYTRGDIGILPPLGPAADERAADTLAWWQNWTAAGDWSLPFPAEVKRSALALKMLSFSLSGAIVAAPTTSLPEAVGGIRNWDYRFCWLRDASLTLGVLLDLGYVGEARSFLDWLLHTTQLTRPKLRVLYDVYGRNGTPERTLDYLEGYRESRPVRVGNGAAGQLQLDIYGAVCLAALKYVRHGGNLEYAERRMLAGFGRIICNCWTEPDNGIWEVRDTRVQNTYSKLMCWTALDSLLRIDEQIGLPIRRSLFAEIRGRIREWIETRAYMPDLHAFMARPDVDAPDIGMLAMARCEFLPADDPRMAGTFEYLVERLGHGPLMYRYPPGTDGLPGLEGTFALGAFWAIEHLARAGHIDAALSRFEAMLAFANDVGLYSEEIDAETGALLGNYPQAFTHVAMISAACSLRDAMRAGRR